jgi:arsenate reductase (glutaredoxin)
MPTRTATVYGIANCDTVKKARSWLDAQGIAYTFHDYKKSGVDAGTLADWCETQGWETLLNQGGTTFRKLSDAAKDGLTEKTAFTLMLKQPSMIKRPVVEFDGGLLVGFKPEQWATVLAQLKPGTA